MSETTEGFLDKVYDLENREDTKALYADWAATYDAETRANGYVSPRRCAEALARFVEDRAAPILDVGCGTGLSGEAFAAAGFTTVDGTDFSPEMLAVAERKGVYRRLFPGAVESPLPVAPGDYAHVAAVGVFSPSHAPASLMDDALALLPRGGCFVFTLNGHALQDPSYTGRVRELVDAGGADLMMRERGPHMPKIGLEAEVVVLRKR